MLIIRYLAIFQCLLAKQTRLFKTVKAISQKNVILFHHQISMRLIKRSRVFLSTLQILEIFRFETPALSNS